MADSPGKERLDKALVARGLVRSRTHAADLIGKGSVQVNGAACIQASRKVGPDDVLGVPAADDLLRYASRAGLKLEAALRASGLDVAAMECLDVGASTGGFTDCLLQRGAARVTAVDVGHGQLVEALREDPRVEMREGINARDLKPEDFPRRFDLAVMDVSFISMRLLLPAVLPLVKPGGHFAGLVKPQFELESSALDKRGVVKTDALRARALQSLVDWFKHEGTPLGWELRGSMECPLPGKDGNQEFWIWANRSSG
jgi:23S rRNA (cytidine1920-2'-O)/16S rRNA (cytidine1409-2'-O)-methyltransferase